MEVYATIFMIFVSHVLSSFSSWQRDGRHIPYPKIRRIPIVHFQNHYNDEDNQQDIALEYVLPLTAGLHREKITNGDTNRNIQYDAAEILKAEIPDAKSQRGSRNLIEDNAFVSSSEKIKSRLHRKKKYSVTNNENVLSSIITNGYPSTNQPFNYLTTNTAVDFMELDKSKNNISSITQAIPEAWANRAKMKYITVRPWNQFCLTCDTTNNLKENSTTNPSSTNTESEDMCITTTTCYPYPTKRKKSSKPCYPTIKNEPGEDQPWLFYAGPTQNRPQPRIPSRSYPTDKCYSTETTICAHKLRNNYLNPKRNNYIENFLIMRPRKKRRNYFVDPKIQLGIIKSVLERYKKSTKKSRSVSDKLPLTNPALIGNINNKEKKYLVPLNINFNKNNLLPIINILNKESLNKFRNEKKCNNVGFFPFFKRNKDYNLTRGIPPCQKACFYNLTDLVNARTIKPPDYFKQRPTLLLCCEDEVNVSISSISSSSTSTVSRSNELDDLEATTGITQITDSPSTDFLDTTDSPSDTTINSNISTPTVFRMLMQLRNMPTKKGSSTSRKPEEKFYLKLLVRTKEDLADSNGLKLKSELGNESFDENPFQRHVMKSRKQKKLRPWNARKYCPCSVGKKTPTCCTDDTSNKLPWAPSCCRSTRKATGKSSKTTSGSSKATTKSTNSTSKSGKSTKIGSTASSGTKANSSTGKATKKRGKTTTSNLKTTNKAIKAKGTIDPYSATIVNIKSTAENTLLRSTSAIITPLTSTEDTVNSSRSKLNQPEEYYKSLNNLKSAIDDENILLIIRVPVAVAQQYIKNGNLGLVLHLSDSFPKSIKPRSILEQFLPCLLRKTTIHPVQVLSTSEDKLSLVTPFANNRKVHNYFPFTTTNESPFLNLNVHKHIIEGCPSCLKRKKELVFETSNGDKKVNCIIDNNNLFFEEVIDNDDSNSYEPSTEECDGKYVSYLLKFPKERMIKSSSSASRESQSTKRGLTILHSDDSPPKYFIEVPELLESVMNLDDNALVTSPSSMSLNENSASLPRSQKPLKHGVPKKPIVLCLQPFGINGHNVYLPMTGIDKIVKNKSKDPVYIKNTDSGDYLDDTPNSPSSTPIISGFLGKNDSVLPFALIPAYLAMHPSNPLSSDSSKKDSTVNAPEDQKPSLDSVSPQYPPPKGEEIALTVLLNNIPSEKKSKLSKQLKGIAVNSLPSKMTSKPSSHPKKTSRKSVSRRPSVASDRPTFIILMKEMANGPFLEDSEFPLDQIHSSTLKQKSRTFIESLGEYAN